MSVNTEQVYFEHVSFLNMCVISSIGFVTRKIQIPGSQQDSDPSPSSMLSISTIHLFRHMVTQIERLEPTIYYIAKKFKIDLP